MAKKTSPNKIQSLKDDWGKDASNNLPYSGQAVQDFIKAQFGKKCGCIKLSTSTDANNYYHVWGFATEDDYKQYITDPDGNASLLLVNEVIPISTVQGDSYGAYLFSDTTANANYVVSGDSFVLKLRFSAVRTSNGERLNMGTMGTLIIQRKVGNGEWTNIETRKDALVSTDYSDTSAMTDVELGNCLASGRQQLRVRAEFEYTAEDGSTKTATSTYVLIGSSVTKTQLDLVCQLNWQTPILASSYTDRGFPISYMVYGAVDKTLHVEVTGGNGQTISVTYPLTAGQDSATISKNITDATDTYKLFQHGVRTVKAWLTADDGKGGTISSKVLVNRFMVINPTTDADKVTPYIMLQNVLTTADNYAQADICQYAVFSPKVNADGTVSNGGDPVPVIFYLTAYSENFPADNPTEYFRIEENVEPGVQKTLNTTIEIESETEQKTIPAYFRIFRKSGNTEINFLRESLGQNNLVIQVDNSESYAPKAGADFVLNPKTRNNSETNPMTIINSQTGKTIESTWNGFGLVKDGWVTSDVDGQRVLRIPAGASVNFKYNPFAQFLTTPDSSCEIELDFMVRNVTNEDDPIISLFENFTTTDTNGQTVDTFRGLKMCPLHGELHTKSNFVSDETDFSWREGVREHISININNAVAPDKGDAIVPTSSTYDTKATKIALVRILIKGDIEREFKFSITDPEEFCTGAMSNGGFTIGQSGADIDIYGMRVYQNNALEPNEVLSDYISTLPTTTEKQQERKRNDILTSGKVDIQKCRNLGIRCIVWVGVEPYKLNTSAQTGYYEIFQYDKQGNYLPEYSGTLCKATASLAATRQGSTANTYYYSNLQTKMSDVTETITVPLSDLHSSISYEVKEIANEDGTITKVVSLKGGNLGKNFPVNESAVDYPYAQLDGADAVVVPDGWVDGNGKYRGVGYIVAEGTPMAQKLVNKINYASSMQSHLTGVNNLYNDLHRIIVGKNSLQEGYPEARVSKYTEPFLFFTQSPDSDTPVYRGPCTFGAGKMDKPTWGYVKKLHPMFTMIEGSDNNYELTDMRVPFTWNEPDCPENITYKGDDEGFFYNNKQCLDFDAGATQSDEQETPTEDLINVIKNAWNFLYLHSPFINYYKGTFDQFQLSDASKNTFAKYWCTDGDDAYKLKRYDFVSGRWVDAGLWNTSTKAWDTFDLRQEEMTKGTYDNSSNQSEYAALNTELRGAIVAHARKYIGFYFRVDSVKLYYTFIIHLMAGTDSCSKNTYYVLDPKPVDVTIDGETRSCYLFEMHTDDVDTMLPIDNNGRATKAYYLDRMHPYLDGDNTTEKYEGMHNVLFTLCEQMWEGTKELQTMLQRIFTAMESLVSESDYIEGAPSDLQKVSVLGCLWKYIYYVHKYIPTVAFNEAARIRYEYPEMIGFVSFGSGARSVRPITQSNGSLLECELQFIIRRLVLMASYAAWGPFGDGKSGNLGIADASEGFAMQAFHLPDSATSTNTYQFNVTPHQYLYPTGMLGQTVVDPHTRVRPGQTFNLVLGSTSSNDTGMSVNGINYYRSIGNVGDLSTTPANTITVNGSRLVEFIAEPSKYYDDMSNSGSQAPAFRPGAIVINARNIQKLSLKGCTGTAGSIDISGLSRLQSVDVRQTRLSDVILPESHALTSVELPATITSVNVTNQQNLSKLTLEGYSNLTRYVVKNNTLINTYTHVIGMYNAKPAGLKTVTIENVAWNTVNTQPTADILIWLADIPARLTGKIKMQSYKDDRYLTAVEVILLIDLYGDVTSDLNPLYVEYDKAEIISIAINNEHYISDLGEHKMNLTVWPANGNNIAAKDNKPWMEWSIDDSANDYASFTDTVLGILTVTKLSDATLHQKHTITVTYHLIDGTVLTSTWECGFFRYIPSVGDFAYADGTFEDYWYTNKECIGIVFMRDKIMDVETLTGYNLRIVGLKDMALTSTSHPELLENRSCFSWGLYNDAGNNTESFSNTVGNEINAATGNNGSAFDVPGVPDVVDMELWNGETNTKLTEENFIDDTKEDGYRVFHQDKTSTKGEVEADFDGKAHTAAIVDYANLVITKYLKETPPTDETDLANKMASLQAANNNEARWWQFFYAPAYSCYLYQPVVEGKLDAQYRKGNWYLLAMGELMRIANFLRYGIKASNADENAKNEARTPIFANANKRAGMEVVTFSLDNYESWGDGYYWSSSERGDTYAWVVDFRNLTLYTSFGSGYGNDKYQATFCYTRPCVQYTFKL